MPDPVVLNYGTTPAPAAAPAPAAEPTPSAAAPPAPQVASIPPAPAVTTPATAEPAPAPSAPAAASLTPPTDSLLSKPPEAVKAPEPAVAEPPKQEPAAPVIPTYAEFKAPEGIELNKEEVGKFTSLLGGLELETKADHAKMEAFGQKVIDLYFQEQKAAQQAQIVAWTQMRDEWKGKFAADPEIGGARQAQTLQRCAAMIDEYGGSKEEINEFRQALGTTGMGDHPLMIKFLNRIGAVLGEGKPVPAVTPRSPIPVSKSQRRYANTMNGGGTTNGAN